MKRIPQPVLVTWHDAWSSEETTGDDPADHEPHVTYSVGFVVRRNRKGIRIARCMDYDTDGTPRYDGTLFVPAGMIVSVRRLSKN